MKFFRKKRFYLISICILLFLVFVFLYFYKFHDGLSNKPDDWGNFGSYIGGIIGSILSGINLIILIILTKQTKEEQNHEWITSVRINKYHELLNDLKNNNPQQYFIGKNLDDDFFLFDEEYDTLMKIQKLIQTEYTVELKDDLLEFLKSIIKNQKKRTEKITKKYPSYS